MWKIHTEINVIKQEELLELLEKLKGVLDGYQYVVVFDYRHTMVLEVKNENN